MNELPDTQRSLPADESGVVYTEYLIVLVLVALVCAAALVALGAAALEYYRDVQLAVTSPVP